MNDDIRDLWSQPAAPHTFDVDRALRDIQQRAARFERTIAFRDWREIAAGLLVAAIFLWFAFRAHDPFVRLADLWIAASGVWIAFHLRRHSTVPRAPSRDRSAEAYRQALLDSFDRQIALLRSVKYWYLLPVWIGLIGLSLAQWRTHHSAMACVVSITVYTAIFGAVWWLNESPGVRYLQRKQAELGSLIQELEGVTQ